MLNRFYFAVPFHRLEEISPTEVAGPGISILHIIDLPTGAEDDPIFDDRLRGLLKHQFSAAGNYRFSLALRTREPVRKEKLEKILAFFFHPCYDRSARGKPVFLFADTPGSLSLIPSMQEICSLQKIEVDLIPITEDPSCHYGIRVSQPAAAGPREQWIGERIGEYYQQYCVNEYNPEDLFIINGCKDNGCKDIGGSTGINGSMKYSLQQLRDDLNESLRALEREHSGFYRMATENIGIKARADAMSRENNWLKKEKKILQELLNLNNKNDEVGYILHFYKNEYEVLPLWYKRMGHIVKVIQGRRNFRSLFDKNVKKYKD